jgi:hypothetical protein
MRTASAVLTGLLLVAGSRPAAAAVQTALTPATLTVGLGAQFDIQYTVTQAGSAFNGFDATVTYDPAALTLIPLSPVSLQQGCLMTGACSGACGNTFHRFAASGDSATITDVLLCDQFSLTGPGQVYKLHFQASNTAQVTHVRLRRAVFYNQGLFVTPVTTADAQITIGSNVGVEDAPAPAGVRVRAETNPGRGAIALVLEADAAGIQRLEILDVSGRRVRLMDAGWREPGSRQVRWDGRDDAGAQVPAGVYLVRVAAADRVARLRVALLR